MSQLSRINKALKVFGALAGLLLFWWLYRSHEDPIGEMVVEMDDIDTPDWDDDEGDDIDFDDDETLDK